VADSTSTMPDEWPLCPECGADGLYRIAYGLIRGAPEPNPRIHYYGCMGGGSQSPSFGCTACQTHFLGPIANLLPGKPAHHDRGGSLLWCGWIPDPDRRSYPKPPTGPSWLRPSISRRDGDQHGLSGDTPGDLAADASRVAATAGVVFELTADAPLRGVDDRDLETWGDVAGLLDRHGALGDGRLRFTFALDEAESPAVFWRYEPLPPRTRPRSGPSVRIWGTLDLAGRVRWIPLAHLLTRPE
jgi:hypothetical protein